MLLEYVLTADTAASRRESADGAHEGSWCRVSLAECLAEWTLNSWTVRPEVGYGNGSQHWRCFRTLRAWRPEPSENMHTSLDFNNVDFLGMLEVLRLLLIFMHRGIWRDFLWWSYYCAFATVPLCLDNTVTVWHWLYDVLIVCLLLCWLRPMYSSRHQGECRSTLRNATRFPPV